ncbi:MAG: proteinase inhibitor I4 serpin [Pseudanabaena frigida]|uniref:Proteinase inhibitor I4 serpin n=1 Tax=Pseudanabaena frigida TaxID=945775 RepID=A0A2W4W930_9CYAN|nr:MAG: proteinase inhibitor I4 serpin [Pseudanabaena frigida]
MLGLRGVYLSVNNKIIMKANSRKTTIGLLAMALVGCSFPDTSNSQSLNSPAPLVSVTPTQSKKIFLDSRLVEANARFGFNLFDRIAQQDKNKNIFISPLSVSIALSMVYNGANGETQQEIARTLELQGIKIYDVNSFNQRIRQSLESGDKNVELNIANSLWVRKDIPIERSFLNIVKDFYQSEIRNLDFDNPSSIATINSWVKQQTKGKIDKILDRIDRDHLFFIINTLYFKGTWVNPFLKSGTEMKPFTLGDGTKNQYPAMSQWGEYLYYDAPTFQAISLPYGSRSRTSSRRFSMEIFLPRRESNLADFQKQLTAKNWQDWSSKFALKGGFIQIPRFEIQYEINLNSVLQKLGMKIAFSPAAEFRNLFSEKAFINEVKHKTFINVNEEGTEAAAVTLVGATRGGGVSAEFKMIVDRPFFFAISDRETGTILFMGAIQNPALK